MLNRRSWWLGVLALLIAGGAQAPAASAGGPFWRVNGAKLSQGTRQLNMQNKGAVVFIGETGGFVVEVECVTSKGEGTTIEGSGAQKPGQGKGKLKFETCATLVNTKNEPCKVVEPILTNQIKAILATSTESTQKKYVAIFEPQQGPIFAKLSLVKAAVACPLEGIPLELKGSIAAGIVPGEAESQEGGLSFPPIAYKTAQLFTQEAGQPQQTKVGLAVGLNEARFVAFYKTSLVTTESWGVFPS